MYRKLTVKKVMGLLLVLMAALFPFLVHSDGLMIEVTGLWTYYASWDRALHFYYLYLCFIYAMIAFITGLFLITQKD